MTNERFDDIAPLAAEASCRIFDLDREGSGFEQSVIDILRLLASRSWDRGFSSGAHAERSRCWREDRMLGECN